MQSRTKLDRRRVFVAAILLAAALLGVLKVWLQRSSPPAWVPPEQRFDGFVAIDGFAHRAAMLRDWLLDLSAIRSAQPTFVGLDLHPTTWTVPFLVAVVAVVVPSIGWSFVLVNLALSALGVWLAGRLAVAVAGEPLRSRRGDACALAATVLVASHVLTVRTCALLIVDWGVVVAALGTVLALLRWQSTRAPVAAVAAAACLTFGVFTKSNALPLLAAPAIAAAYCATARMRAFATAAAITAAPIGGLALAAVGGGQRLGVDVAHLLASIEIDVAHALRFAGEMALLWQWLPAALGRSAWANPARRTVATIAALQFVATAAIQLPVIPRLWLPVLFLVVPLAAGTVGDALTMRRLLGIAMANLLLGAIALAFAGA